MTEHQMVALLEPISESSACGPDLQYDPAYDRIRLAREVKTQRLPAGVWEKEDEKVDWPSIAMECMALLQHQSKDLQVTAWLCESMAKAHGMTGLRRGLHLMDQLTHTYWDDIHPLPDDGDWSNRLRAFEWLGRELPRWLEAHVRADATDAQSPWHSTLSGVVLSLQNMQQLLEDKLQESVLAIKEVLDRLKTQLERWTTSPTTPLDTPINPRHTVNSRGAAYEQLRGIAEFLSKHEPHSPVPEILRAISEWQNVEFGQLLTRLPANGPSVYDLARLFTLTKDRT